jgi:hypothetical protein
MIAIKEKEENYGIYQKILSLRRRKRDFLIADIAEIFNIFELIK